MVFNVSLDLLYDVCMCHTVSCGFTHMHMYIMAVCYIQYGGCSGVDVIVGLEGRGASSLHVLAPPTLVRMYAKSFGIAKISL